MDDKSYNSNGKKHCFTASSKNNKSDENGKVIIRKGPWKAEEDKVLIDHVNKFGPRDWSSIRSNGLLSRTGKSCRLRWVNKLRPNLKKGCKFTAEEERIVIELQAELGNKWAKIATHLSGRTDNDVKNFWSSRQKRLARILRSQSPQRLYKKRKSSSTNASFLEVPKTSFIKGEISSQMQCSSSSSYTGTSSTTNTMQIVPFSHFITPDQFPSSEADNHLDFEPCPLNVLYPTNDEELQSQDMMNFPSVPLLQTYLSETQELIVDSSFLQSFGSIDDDVLIDDGLQLLSCCGDDCTGFNGRNNDNPSSPSSSFFDDFPSDIFDQIEPLPSPSSW